MLTIAFQASLGSGSFLKSFKSSIQSHIDELTFIDEDTGAQRDLENAARGPTLWVGSPVVTPSLPTLGSQQSYFKLLDVES